MLDIPVNAKVSCRDGHAGTSTYIIMNPINQEVSHIVVQEFIHGRSAERMVPMGAIASTTPSSIELNMSLAELTELPEFIEDFYIQNVQTEADASGILLEPFVTPMDLQVSTVISENIPTDGIVVRRGMSIEATDGFVGKVRELIIDPVNHKVTHVLLHKGHLFGQKDMMIPLANVERIDADTIFLGIDKTAVNDLQQFSIQRHYDPPKEDEES